MFRMPSPILLLFLAPFTLYFLIQLIRAYEIFSHRSGRPIYTTVVLAIDSLRPSYLQHMPFLASLAGTGYTINPLIPSFPSNTFPNFATLVTGHTPAMHGIINNGFYDPVTKKTTDLFKEKAPGCLLRKRPLWDVLEADKHPCASIGFPTTSWQWQCAHKPSHVENFLHSNTPKKILDDIARAHKASRYALIMGYIHHPDKTGHRSGPESAETISVLKDIDAEIRAFYAALGSGTNFVVVGDHGMQTIDNDVWIDTLFFEENCTEFLLTTPAMFYAKEGMAERVYEYVVEALGRHCKVYRRAQGGDDQNFGDFSHTPDVWAVPAPGVNFHATGSKDTPFKGGHGYDVNAEHMKTVLIATGPELCKRPRVESDLPNTIFHSFLLSLVVNNDYVR